MIIRGKMGNWELKERRELHENLTLPEFTIKLCDWACSTQDMIPPNIVRDRERRIPIAWKTLTPHH